MRTDDERREIVRQRWQRRIADPEFLARHRRLRNERRRLLRRDPEYRKKQREARRRVYHADPEQRERTLIANERYRRANLEKIKVRRREQRTLRRLNDPSYREQRRREVRRALRVRQTKLIAAIRAAIPSGYPPHVRDDIAGEMHLAVCQRRLGIRDVGRRVREFTTAYWRANSPYETVSLDAPVFPGGPSFADVLSAPEESGDH